MILPVDLRAQRASRHGLARQTLARLPSGCPCESDSVVAALVNPQLFVLAYSRGVQSWPAAPGGVSSLCYVLGFALST